MTCECGGSIVNENGKFVCDKCGKEIIVHGFGVINLSGYFIIKK